MYYAGHSKEVCRLGLLLVGVRRTRKKMSYCLRD